MAGSSTAGTTYTYSSILELRFEVVITEQKKELLQHFMGPISDNNISIMFRRAIQFSRAKCPEKCKSYQLRPPKVSIYSQLASTQFLVPASVFAFAFLTPMKSRGLRM